MRGRMVPPVLFHGGRMDFTKFNKIPRYSRDILITEKIDGTNGQIAISEDGEMFVGSRNRWITPEDDNQGFAAWCRDHYDELITLGPGRHFGEWWGYKIQRGYNLKERRFTLFNVGRWGDGEDLPPCCSLVPVVGQGPHEEATIAEAMRTLREYGSSAAPGYMNPEGIVILHVASGHLYKKTFENDAEGKPA